MITVNKERAEEYSADRMRMQRDALLAACDWTMVPDSTADKVAWGAYRQMLRDVPEQSGFPNKVEWPIAPD